MPTICRTWFVLAAFGAILAAGACSRSNDEQKQSGQAFLDSQIPSGLAPQYFPPQGFVWGGYSAGALPQARYGVASPPVNPRAQVLILADAEYPAEAYFELANQLLEAGYGVWLFEVPGQGGAGQYKGQDGKIFARSYRDGQLAILGFIRDIVHPTPDKPLYIVGTGYSALNALSLSAALRDKTMAGFIAYAPYLGGQIDPGVEWHRENQARSYWGAVAHNWQISNPDLRLTIKSESWQEQARKAYADLNGVNLPVVSLTESTAPVLLIEPQDAPSAIKESAGSLCARLSRCKTVTTSGPQMLGSNIAEFIKMHEAALKVERS